MADIADVEEGFKCFCRDCSQTFRTDTELMDHFGAHVAIGESSGVDDMFPPRPRLRDLERPPSSEYKSPYEQNLRSKKESRPFKCPIPECNGHAGFSFHNDLARHIASVHENRLVWRCSCPKCKSLSRIFMRRDNLIRHMKGIQGQGEITFEMLEVARNVMNSGNLRNFTSTLPSVPREADVSCASSVSGNSSIPSQGNTLLTLGSPSSVSSVVSPAGAAERFTSLLLSDQCLLNIYVYASNRIHADRFERNLRRLLKYLSFDLQEEAENHQHKMTAKFVRYHARNTAHVLRNNIYHAASLPENDDLISNAKDSEILEGDIMEEVEESGDDDLDRDDDEPSDFQQLENFIVASRAFEKFKNNLKNFVDPRPQLEFKQPPWAVSTPLAALRTFWEPPVPENRVRVRWNCKCGKPMYDDYIEVVPGAAKRLEVQLNSRSGNAKSTARSPSFATHLTSIYRTFLASLRRRWSDEKNEIPLQETQAAPGTRQPSTALSSTPSEALYLLICHNSKQSLQRLSQLPIGDIKSDEKVFRALNDIYRSQFATRRSCLSLRTLKSIKFVRFELYRKSQLVDVRAHNELPEVENKDYRYNPCPTDLIPPVGENTLLHFINDPDCAEDVPACLDRLPKKLKEKLTCGEKPVAPGWGLHLEEGVNTVKMVIVCLLSILLSSIFGIGWTVVKGDIQGGFTVGAYIVGVTIPLFTLIQVLE